MQIGQIGIREVVCASPDMTVLDAARMMRERHVGDVVVVEHGKKGAVPIGIVTDRDIVVAIVAPGLEISQLSVRDIMSDELVTASEDQDVFEAVERMRRYGVRRLPILDRQGVLLGIIAVDDLLELMAMQLSDLARVVRQEQKQEVEART